uniref:radical SAM family heme chaperone HemW n=1 Tax=Prevotella sp. TaxID=59823 RepID=UPI0040299732
MPSSAGLYVHIPFCASRCVYCGFYSTTSLSLRQRYVDALCREMRMLTFKPKISTIYLGGGTPSQLTHEELNRLFTYIYNVYDVAPDAEVTMECNPDDIHAGMFNGLSVNRVSMGAQTFSDARLRFLRRRHTAKEVDRAVDTLRHDGIGNISIDLMFGFPDETLDDWKRDVAHAISLRPEHVSAYGLMFEEGTPLYRMLDEGKVKEIDEELSLRMYSELVDTLGAAGYEHYEISNFARFDGERVSKWRSRHNSSYWHDIPYIGIGAGAHSYYQATRHWNPDNIIMYMDAIEHGRLPYEEEKIDSDTHYDDIVMTALRTREGICLDRLDSSHRAFLLANAKAFVDSGLLALENGHLRLTREGINVSNRIMSDLMDV